jgi:hypothetical protein
MMRPTERHTRSSTAAMPILALLATVAACAPAIRSTADKPLTQDELAQLWSEPADITSRDLLQGPGNDNDRPAPNSRFKVIRFDGTGNSVGYDVVDGEGREWKVKVGEEVRPEIVASRLLWAIGFHQPPMFLVGNLQLEGGRAEDSGQPARLRSEHGYKTESDWFWHQNPYVGTRQLKGLLVAQLIVNNWDLKATQNRIYLLDERARPPRRRYVVQDLGAALGKTSWPTGTRDNIVDFEGQRLVKSVENDVVTFDYHARHRELFKDITPADVVWTARLFSRLTDKQWSDAFRAANYQESLSQRFIAKLKSKVEEGLALDKRARLTR